MYICDEKNCSPGFRGRFGRCRDRSRIKVVHVRSIQSRYDGMNNHGFLGRYVIK